MIERILNHFGYIKKPQTLQEKTEQYKLENCIVSDEVLLAKAQTLIGQKATINGCCGDVEKITLMSVVNISDAYGYKEVRFTTDDDFYQTVLFKAKTIMNWKYN